MVLPADMENFAKVAQVELVEFLDMPPVASPSLAAVQERRKHNSVYPQLGLDRNAPFMPYSGVEASKCLACS